MKASVKEWMRLSVLNVWHALHKVTVSPGLEHHKDYIGARGNELAPSKVRRVKTTTDFFDSRTLSWIETNLISTTDPFYFMFFWCVV